MAEIKMMRAYVGRADFTPKEGYVLTEREKNDKRALKGNQVFKNLSLAVEDVPVPVPTGRKVLIKVAACGVCGTDLSVVRCGDDGYTGYDARIKFPVILGHEFSGEVVAIGDEVETLEVGDLVVAEPMQWCGRCANCRKGDVNNCLALDEIGLTMDGGFAQYYMADEKSMCKMNAIYDLYKDKKKALEVAAIVEPACVSYGGMIVQPGGFKPGGTVVVYGVGAIGLTSIALARASGAAKIIAFATREARAKIAKEVGADIVLNPRELAAQGISQADMVMKYTDGLGADMVVECTSAGNTTYPEIVNMMAPRGVIVQLGVQAATYGVDISTLQTRNVKLLNRMGHAGDDIFPAVIRMIASGRLNVEPIITAKFPLEQIEDAFEAASNGNEGKVIVTID